MAFQRSRLSLWLTRGGFAVIDQGLFAGANFLANVLLARWLPTEQFGTFSIGYSLLMLFGAVHSAVLGEPMSVFGAGKYADRFGPYLRLLVRGHWMVGIITALLLAGAACMLSLISAAADLSWTLASLALSLPCILLLWLLRRAFYVILAPGLASIGSLLYLVLVPAGLYGLQQSEMLSPHSAFLAVGVVSLIIAAIDVFLLRLLGTPAAGSHLSRSVFMDHVSYGKWTVGASLVVWLSSNVQNFIVAGVASLSAAGALRALDNILVPFWQFQSALSGLLLPVLSNTAARSRESFPSRILRIALFFAILATAAYLFLTAFGAQLITLLYGQRYSSYLYLLPWYALILLPESVSAVLLIAHRALVETRTVFVYHCLLLAGMVVIGYPSVALHGLPGIIYSRVAISYLLLGLLLPYSRKALAVRITA